MRPRDQPLRSLQALGAQAVVLARLLARLVNGAAPVYQLDHVFADTATKLRATDWRVDRRPIEREKPLSDHAPIILELKPQS